MGPNQLPAKAIQMIAQLRTNFTQRYAPSHILQCACCRRERHGSLEWCQVPSTHYLCSLGARDSPRSLCFCSSRHACAQKLSICNLNGPHAVYFPREENGHVVPCFPVGLQGTVTLTVGHSRNVEHCSVSQAEPVAGQQALE